MTLRFTVVTASTITEFESLGSNFDPEESIALICYTVPEDEAEKIRKTAGHSVYFLDHLMIPIELIHKVSELLH
jgi:hypothetical protein